MNRGHLAGLVAGAFCMVVSNLARSQSLSTVVSFNPAVGDLPESITADAHGNLLVSVNGSVRKIDPSHTVSTVAPLPLPAGAFSGGIKVGPAAQIYVASSSFSPTPNASFVWRVAPAGTVTQFAELDPNGFPNDLAFDDDDNLYVTDSFLGRVWKIDPHGGPSVWLTDPLFQGNPAAPVLAIHEFGIDGIAFDEKKKYLYFSNLDYGEILRVRFNDHGLPGPVEVFANDARLRGADGIAFDTKDSLYVAVNGQDQIAVVDNHGNVALVAQGSPLDSPASLVFGTGAHDSKTLYISNFAIARVLGLKSGTPNPAILSLGVPQPGLPLP